MSAQPLQRDRSEHESVKKGLTPVENISEPQAVSDELVDLEEGVHEVHDELRKATITQITLTLLAILAICYFAKLVLVTIFTSILVAFILEPIVRAQQKIRIPRPVGSMIAVLLVLGILYGLSYFFYQRAVDFAHQLPKMSGEIRKIAGKYQHNAEQIRNSAQQVIPPSNDEKNAVPVKVQDEKGLAGVLGPQLARNGWIISTAASSAMSRAGSAPACRRSSIWCRG